MTITAFDYATKSYNTFAQGATLKKGKREVRIMSDVWGTEEFAKYWDDGEGRVRDVTLATYEYSPDTSYKPGTVEVDATAEVKNKVRQYFYDIGFAKAKEAAEQAAAIPQKGDIVKVVRGRNGKGTVGTVVVAMYSQYGMGWKSNTERKFGIATSDVKVKVVAKNGKVYENFRDMVWVWARNVELAETPEINMIEVTGNALAYAEKMMAEYA